MSEVYKTNECTLLDHREFIANVYKGVENFHEPLPVFTLLAKIFCIKSELKKEKQTSRARKRYLGSDEMLTETRELKQMYEQFKQKIPHGVKEDIKNKYDVLETEKVRELAQKLFESTIFDHKGHSGMLESDHPTRISIGEDGHFLIPGKSRFYCGSAKEKCQQLAGSQFDLVIADPPWWNKYIRRLKGANDKLSYKMMYNEDIASIPVAHLLAQDCLVAVWCTNAPSNIAAVKDLIFPAWGVQYVATWYWMKVTIDLEPLCEFSSGSRKQPYERLILGQRGEVKEVPTKHLFMSVPSALHSHKPPLLDLLNPYAPKPEEKPRRVLELFARYLLPHTTSIGLEPLKWCHESLFESVGTVADHRKPSEGLRS